MMTSPSSQEKAKITIQNWNYCRYRLADMFVYISFGAEPSAFSEEILEYYFVTSQNNDFQDLYQKKFLSLQEACHYINQTYDHWDFEDPSLLQEGGCGSCQAH